MRRRRKRTVAVRTKKRNQHRIAEPTQKVPLNDGRPPWATNGTRKKKNHEEMKKMDGREKQKIVLLNL